MVEGLFKNGLNQTRGKMQDVSSNSQGCEIIFEVAFHSGIYGHEKCWST